MNKPNVIFVLTDDQGYGDLACHGNPIIKNAEFGCVNTTRAFGSRISTSRPCVHQRAANC